MPPSTNGKAWQPLTPRGVARFADASLWRLLLVQLLFAATVAAAVVWFFHAAWFPAIDEAIRHLPDQGEIRAGRLAWAGDAVQSLGGGRWIAFSVDLDHTGRTQSHADLQVEFGRSDFRLSSLFGDRVCAYPTRGWLVAFNRTELLPWWGAWGPPILWITFALVAAACLVLWALLAAVWLLPVWLSGFFANRALTFQAGWKLAGAAMIPGSLVLVAAIVAYGLGILDLVQFLAAAAAHLLAGGVYAIAGAFCVRKIPAATMERKNPFANTS